MPATGIIPTVDFVFKRLFGVEENRDLLIHFLNGVMQFPEGQRIVSVEFGNPARNRVSDDDKLTIVDILVYDQRGRPIIVEMQVIAGSAFCERIVYYWACEFADQIEGGDDYGDLQPTIVVCVSVNTILKETETYHHRFRLQSDDSTILFTDRLEIHTIELSKFELAAEGLASDLERWTYFLKHGEELDPSSLPSSLEAPPIPRAVEVLNVISQNKKDRAKYRARLKRQRDYESHDKLLIAKGIEEGEARGELLGQVKLLERQLSLPPTSQEEFKAMSIEDLTQRIAALESQQSSRPN